MFKHPTPKEKNFKKMKVECLVMETNIAVHLIIRIQDNIPLSF